MAKDPAVVAVQKVLYDPRRLAQLRDQLSSIDVFMNLDPTRALQPGDVRAIAGSGPSWWIPATGALSNGVVEAAQCCDRIAAIHLAMRRDLARLAIPPADKQQLRLGLAELAASWTERARAWRAPAGQDAEASATAISKHTQASLQAFRRARRYLAKGAK